MSPVPRPQGPPRGPRSSASMPSNLSYAPADSGHCDLARADLFEGVRLKHERRSADIESSQLTARLCTPCGADPCAEVFSANLDRLVDGVLSKGGYSSIEGLRRQGRRRVFAGVPREVGRLLSAAVCCAPGPARAGAMTSCCAEVACIPARFGATGTASSKAAILGPASEDAPMALWLRSALSRRPDAALLAMGLGVKTGSKACRVLERSSDADEPGVANSGKLPSTQGLRQTMRKAADPLACSTASALAERAAATAALTLLEGPSPALCLSWPCAAPRRRGGLLSHSPAGSSSASPPLLRL